MKTRYWLLMLVAIGSILRLALAIGYEPMSSPDTGTYFSAAQDLIDGSLARSEGRRTPGYPLLIALAGGSPENVAIAQLMVGLAISLLLFYIVLLVTRRPAIAFLAGLSYNLNMQQLFLEAVLLSEATSTLSVVAVIAVMLACFHRLRRRQPSAAMLVVLGLVGGVCILVRPQYIFLPVILPLAIAYAVAGRRILSPAAIKGGVLVALPMIVLVLGWSAFIYAKVGIFTLSTQSGFGMVNHVIGYIELAPDRYATIREILLKHRAKRMAEVGHDRNTIWYAFPEIRETTGLSLPEASREFQRMSVQMFKEHPLRYAVSVANAWIDFWTVPIWWDLNRIEASWLRAPLEAIWWVEHKLLRAANAAFMLLVLMVVVSRGLRQRLNWDLDLTSIVAVILCSSIVQALADQGASSRYAVTIQPLVIVVLIIAWWRFRESYRQAPSYRRGSPASDSTG